MTKSRETLLLVTAICDAGASPALLSLCRSVTTTCLSRVPCPSMSVTAAVRSALKWELPAAAKLLSVRQHIQATLIGP